MKYILTLLLCLPLLVKSQDTIKIPTPIAKQIAKDLVSCDSIKALHTLTTEELLLTQDKLILKDNIISNYVDKGIMYEERIQNEQSKFKVQELWVEDLRKMNKQLKAKLLYTKISMGVGIAFLGYLLLR
jgi:uncharacterized protein with ATP-grasp and redox domains